MTLLQIEDAASDYVTRYIALLSLVCALVSLVYGCIYIVRFGTMRKPHKAAEWALVRLFISIKEVDEPCFRKRNNERQILGGMPGSCWLCPPFGKLGNVPSEITWSEVLTLHF